MHLRQIKFFYKNWNDIKIIRPGFSPLNIVSYLSVCTIVKRGELKFYFLDSPINFLVNVGKKYKIKFILFCL